MGSLFTVEGSAPDVQELLQELGDSVACWEAGGGRPVGHPQASGLTSAQIDALVQGLRLKARVNGQAIIHSTRPRLGPKIIWFQLVVRRLTWWFLEPILQQIRAFQADSALAIVALANAYRSLQAEVAELNAGVERSAGSSRHSATDEPSESSEAGANES